MVSLKALEKKRIEKIRSLNESQIKNYIDVLIKDVCKLHDFNSVVNPDERINDIADIYVKLNEIKDLTGDKFNNINNYINVTLNSYLCIASTVELNKSVVKDANAKNLALLLKLKQLLINYSNFKMYTALLYDLLYDFNELSNVAPTVANKKSAYIDALKIPILTLKNEIEKNVAEISNGFYSDDVIVNDINDLKFTIKNLAESDDENDELFVEFGIINVLTYLIKSYEKHSEIKEIYIKYTAEIDDLFSDSGNIFKKYSAEKYDADSGISFNNFMKSEPKFNIDTGELLEI